MCRNVIVQHCPRALAPASAEPYFQTDSDESNDPKGPEIYNLHKDDTRGVVLQPPHGTKPAAVKIK